MYELTAESESNSTISCKVAHNGSQKLIIGCFFLDIILMNYFITTKPQKVIQFNSIF